MNTLLLGALNVVGHIPGLHPFANRVAINKAVGSTLPRPYPYSLWSPSPTIKVTPEPYVSWTGLVDRTFTGRHLPAAPQSYVNALPPIANAAALFRRNHFTPSSRTSTLFCFFAQWFTDSFLRTDPLDNRKNTSNHEIDLCQIYGLDAATSRILRSGKEGKLLTQVLPTGVFPPRLFDANGVLVPSFQQLRYFAEKIKDESLIEWMVSRSMAHLPAADIQRRKRALFVTGLERGSNTIAYAALNAVFLREHNRICDELLKAHPAWDDDRLFETARNINIVQGLKLVIEEYINHLAGLPFNFKLDCSFAEHQSWYRTNRIAIEFNLLYRWHSMIPDMLNINGGLKPDDYRFNNEELERVGAEAIIAAASRQPAGRIMLHNSPDFMIPAETAALQFARDFRLQSFNAYRKRFGLQPYSTYMALTEDAALAKELEQLYGPSVDNVEFVVGLFAEHHDKDTSFGELLRIMVAVDAFSQVFTNPLLSSQCFGIDAAFGSVGMRIYKETTGLEDIVRRNAPPGATMFAKFKLQA